MTDGTVETFRRVNVVFAIVLIILLFIGGQCQTNKLPYQL
jgi:hypothetical protein